MILHSCVVLPANIRQQMRQHPRSHVRRRIVQSARKNHINKSRDRMRWETVTIVLRRESVGLYPPGTQWLFHFGLAHAMILWDKVVVEAEGFVKCQVRWHDKEICKANQRVPHRQSSFSQQNNLKGVRNTCKDLWSDKRCVVCDVKHILWIINPSRSAFVLRSFRSYLALLDWATHQNPGSPVNIELPVMSTQE